MYCGPTAIAYVLGPKVHWKDVTRSILSQRRDAGEKSSFKRFGGCHLGEIKTYLEQHNLKLEPTLEPGHIYRTRDIPRLVSGRCRFLIHQPRHFYGVRSRADLKRGARLWPNGRVKQVYRLVPKTDD